MYICTMLSQMQFTAHYSNYHPIPWLCVALLIGVLTFTTIKDQRAIEVIVQVDATDEHVYTEHQKYSMTIWRMWFFR